MDAKKAFQSSKGNKNCVKGSDQKSMKDQKPKTSTPVRERSFGNESNISHISSASDIASKLKGANMNPEKENLQTDSLARENLIELKSIMLQRSHLFQQHKENLEAINRQINELREKVQQEKEELYATKTVFEQISLVEKRFQIESENQDLTSDSDMQLQQRFEQLMATVNRERNELKLKNISQFSDDQFQKLLTEAGESIESFHESGESERVEKLVSFLLTLEESTEKCNATREKCAQITESIKRLLLHGKVLKAIHDNSKSCV